MSGKSAAKTRHSNRKWIHTRKTPSASKNKGKWRLGATFYVKLSSKKGKFKYTTDGNFRSDFGCPVSRSGLYNTKEEAEKDITHFRAALESANERPGQGGTT